jgi:hypothetical protein
MQCFNVLFIMSKTEALNLQTSKSRSFMQIITGLYSYFRIRSAFSEIICNKYAIIIGIRTGGDLIHTFRKRRQR